MQTIWCENNGHGTEWIEHIYSDGMTSQMIIQVADINQDDKNEIIVSPQSSGSNIFGWFSRGSSATDMWIKHIIKSPVSHMHGLGVGDFNNDGNLDLHTSLRHDLSGSNDDISIWLSDGNSSPVFTEQILATTGSHFSKVGDIGSDGDPDIIGANWSGIDPFELWENLTLGEIE